MPHIFEPEYQIDRYTRLLIGQASEIMTALQRHECLKTEANYH